MSYDLYLKPRRAHLDREDFHAHFSGSSLFEISDAEVLYRNEETGTYFTFTWRDVGTAQAENEEPEPSYPIWFNLNFFRPSTFALEAAPHVTALVQAFDLVVSDPQANGMGEGDFSVKGFFAGWNAANEWAIGRIVEEHGLGDHNGLLPQSEIHRTWRWNLGKVRRQTELEERGIDRFVPRRMYVRLDGRVATMIVWPDGIPFESLSTDYVLVIREKLAPRSFLRPKPDKVLVRWSDLRAVIESHASSDADGVVALMYDNAPPDVGSFIKKLPVREPEIKLMSPDCVLDAEHAPPAAQR